MANLAFSVFAAVASLAVAVLSAVKGVYAPAAVFGVLAVGFVFRATETRWRNR
jgi:ABC-type xylose transport system permease subunit